MTPEEIEAERTGVITYTYDPGVHRRAGRRELSEALNALNEALFAA